MTEGDAIKAPTGSGERDNNTINNASQWYNKK
jgi:hypothetical protein